MDVQPGTVVWHSRLGQGTIQSIKDDSLKIQFESGTENIWQRSFGKALFLEKEEINYSDYGYLIEKYGISSKILDYRPVDSAESIVKLAKSGEGRSFVILSIRPVKAQCYLEVLALDVITQTIVALVDTNGMEYGYHTVQPDIKRLKPMDVIQVFVKPTPNAHYSNEFRVAGSFAYIGRSHWEKLLKKYRYVMQQQGTEEMTVYTSFSDLFSLAQVHAGVTVPAIVRFSGSEIHIHDGKQSKPQMKMGPVFADLYNLNLGKYYDGQAFYCGDALVTAYVVPGEHRARVRVLRLFASLDSSRNKVSRDKVVKAFTTNFLHGMDFTPENTYPLYSGDIKAFGIDLQKALCNVDGGTSEEQMVIYKEALYLLEHPCSAWSAAQKSRYFDGKSFNYFKDLMKKTDYDLWVNGEARLSALPTFEPPWMSETDYAEEYVEYCMNAVLHPTLPIHAAPQYLRFTKALWSGYVEEREMCSELADKYAQSIATYDDELAEDDSEYVDALNECDDSFYREIYEEYSEYGGEEFDLD